MTEQTAPEAVALVASGWGGGPIGLIEVLRDAIHRDGADADAIREALGLRWEERKSWWPIYYAEDEHGIHHARRVFGEWQEVP